MVDVPGATPSQLVLALGKDSNAYLLDRNNLGGITSPVAQANVAGINRGTSAVTYHTSQGTYIGFHNDAGTIRAYKITPTNPPTITFAWSMSQTGRGSPWVTTTDGTNNTIVWVAGVSGDQRLHGYDGDTGAVIYAGGGANELMTGTRQWNTGIAARGRIYFGADNKIYAFQRFQPELLRLLQLLRPTPTATSTCHTYCNRDSYSYGNCDTNCDGHGNFDGHANCDSDANCHSHRFRQSDTDTQTNPHSEIPCDTEAATESAAKAGRSVTLEPMIGSASSQPARLAAYRNETLRNSRQTVMSMVLPSRAPVTTG